MTVVVCINLAAILIYIWGTGLEEGVIWNGRVSMRRRDQLFALLGDVIVTFRKLVGKSYAFEVIWRLFSPSQLYGIVHVHQSHPTRIPTQQPADIPPHSLPISQAFSLLPGRSVLVVSGRPRLVSSSSMTFQRPTAVSFSTMPILARCSVTFARPARSLRMASTSASFGALIGLRARARTCLTVLAAPSFASGMSVPVSW